MKAKAKDLCRVYNVLLMRIYLGLVKAQDIICELYSYPSKIEPNDAVTFLGDSVEKI